MGIFASKPASKEAPKNELGAPKKPTEKRTAKPTEKPTKPAKEELKTKTSFREEDFDARLPRM
jgi:hypothetical protein